MPKPTKLQSLALKLERDLCKKAMKDATLKKKGPKKIDWFFEVSLVSSDEIQDINRDFLKHNYPTDVLSFPSNDTFLAMGHLGEVIIALPVLKAQAKAQGHTPEKELQVLMTHGLLHLLGFDHEKGPKYAKEMLALEKKLLGPRMAGLISRVNE